MCRGSALVIEGCRPLKTMVQQDRLQTTAEDRGVRRKGGREVGPVGPLSFLGGGVKYTDLKLYDFQELNGDLQPKGKGRSSGMHVSGLVKAAYIKQFKKTPGPIDGEQPFVRSTMGFIWERALEFAFKEYMQAERKFVIKGRTVELDGVIGSLDGINVKDGCVEEYKCTWRSMRKWSDDPEAEFWMWLAQVKAYCHMVNHTRVRFFIFWVNGDYSYKTGRGPQVTTCEMEFTKEELEDNWRMLLAHMNIAKEEVHG